MAVSAVVIYPNVTRMTGIGAYIVETRVPNMVNDYELALDLELTQTRSRDVILANGPGSNRQGKAELGKAMGAG